MMVVEGKESFSPEYQQWRGEFDKRFLAAKEAVKRFEAGVPYKNFREYIKAAKEFDRIVVQDLLEWKYESGQRMVTMSESEFRDYADTKRQINLLLDEQG